MKQLKISLVTMLIVCINHKSSAQALNLHSFDRGTHAVTLSFGLNFGLTYQLSYAYSLNSINPIILHLSFSVPSGNKIMDDLKVKMAGQFILINDQYFKTGISLAGVFRRHQTSKVRMVNFGSEMGAILGYYKSNWFLAGEAGFDKAIVTHLKHTEVFQNNDYYKVENGWYGPTTGGNFYYGMQGGFTIKKTDLILNGGKILTQDFKTTPALPFYLNAGVTNKLKQRD